MTVSSANRTALFIDGVNLYSTARALGFDIDYKRLLKEFQSHGTLVRAFYYTAVIEDEEFSSVRPLLDWLDYNGFTVVTKPTKEFIDSNGHRKVKGNMDVELTVDAMELADRVDQIVLFSGGGDFRSLVEAVQRRGVRVTVVSTISRPASNNCRRTSPPGGRIHRSDGFAVQNRPRSAPAPSFSRNQSAFNASRSPADAFERQPEAWELQGLTDFSGSKETEPFD
jgi:uncharacterized LabA/DUF88 family protein